MKYGIRLKGTIGVGGRFLQAAGRSTLAEHGGSNNNSILEFDTIADAEIYAQNHEIRNYDIEPVVTVAIRNLGPIKECRCGDTNCACRKE